MLKVTGRLVLLLGSQTPPIPLESQITTLKNSYNLWKCLENNKRRLI